MSKLEQYRSQVRKLAYELMSAEVLGTYCEDFVNKRKVHDNLLEAIYKLEKRVF